MTVGTTVVATFLMGKMTRLLTRLHCATGLQTDVQCIFLAERHIHVQVARHIYIVVSVSVLRGPKKFYSRGTEGYLGL